MLGGKRQLDDGIGYTFVYLGSNSIWVKDYALGESCLDVERLYFLSQQESEASSAAQTVLNLDAGLAHPFSSTMIFGDYALQFEGPQQFF